MTHQGFLTHIAGIDLPLKSLDIRLILAIEDGIRVAWMNITRDVSKLKMLSSCKEVDITLDLELALEELLSKPGSSAFTDLYFSAPKRGVESVNYSGTALEKRPDLTFDLPRRQPGVHASKYEVVSVECKILDSGSRNISLYLSKGLIRFVNGDYAWAVPNALMIGYNRTSEKAKKSLTDFFVKSSKSGVPNSVQYNLQSGPKLDTHSPWVCCTEHKRLWSYPPDGKRKPGNIRIRHLWLDI